MLFNSAVFICFFVIVYLVYINLKSFRVQNMLLLLASYVFYGYWDWRFLSLLLASTLIDYFVALNMANSGNKKAKKKLLCVSLVFNLGMLGVFKYYNFGIDSFVDMMEYFGVQVNAGSLEIILPVGISFYTFQTISYTVDVYRGRREPTKNILNFALYVAFFPQLVAGPIEKATTLLPQLEKKRIISTEDIKIGWMWILLGYFKKVVIADTLAPMVEQAFSHVDEVSGVVSLVAIVAFALQIYGDFAGYTLIARGVSRLMGIKLMRNFKSPYLATSPRDFWKRWHISLSSWLMEYLYFGLGGNRLSRMKTYRNLMITMLLGGLWHGARWNFVLWGLYHGLLLVVCHLWQKRRGYKEDHIPNMVAIPLMFVFTLFGWLIFRVDSVGQMELILMNIAQNFVWDVHVLQYLKPTVICFALIMLYHLWLDSREDELALLKINPHLRFGVYSFVVICILAIGFKPTVFLYFQF